MSNTNEKEFSKEELTVEAMRRFQRSPFAFIEESLGEMPQPIKPEYRDYVLHLYNVSAYEFSEYAASITEDMFEPFVRGKHLTWQQTLVIIAIQRAVNGSLPAKIAVKAGRGVGKSNLVSKIILWYLFSFPLSKIPCTAPTADQLFSVLWSEINLTLANMKPEFAAFFEWETKFIRIKQRPQVWYARAKTAGKGETGALSGIHADYMMSIADEAYDVEDEVFHIASATQTGLKAMMLLIGNAVNDHGFFYDCFNKNKDEWVTLTLNGENSPIVNKETIQAEERMHGRQSNHYRASVLGEFPVATAIDVEGWMRLFSDDWIDSVMPKNATDEEELFQVKNFQIGRSFLGVDPSGEGTDEMVGYLRNHNLAMTAFNRVGGGVPSCAKAVIGTMETFGLDQDDVTHDNFGVGAELGQEVIAQSQSRFFIHGRNVGDKCEDILDQTAYSNERARMYDALYWWGKRGGRIRYDEVLREELKTIFHRKNESGKKQIMPKREMRKRDFRSPNRADSLAMSTLNDRMLSNYVPRADFRGLPSRNAKLKEEPEEFDKHSMAPSF